MSLSSSDYDNNIPFIYSDSKEKFELKKNCFPQYADDVEESNLQKAIGYSVLSNGLTFASFEELIIQLLFAFIGILISPKVVNSVKILKCFIGIDFRLSEFIRQRDFHRTV